MTDTRDTAATPGRRAPAARGGRSGRVRSLPRRTALYYRQVVAELRKVIWPGRPQLLTYTAVVLVFVTVVIAVVALLDLGFTKLVFWLFA